MKLFVVLLLALVSTGCHHVSKNSFFRSDTLSGIYDGREVVDTEERLTLRADQTFTYDFMPLGQTGESYSGRWRSEKNVVILVGKLESGEEEELSLELAYEKDVPTLTYTWASHQKQRATMLIPNVFVRSTEPIQEGSVERSRHRTIDEQAPR